MTDFQKFLIGILAGIFIAVLVVVGILFFTKSKTSDSAAADTQILAKIEAEKEELARLQEKIAKKEAELEQAKKEAEKERELLEAESIKKAEEINKNLAAASEKEKKAAEEEKKKKAEEALKRAEEARKRQEELIKQQQALKEAEAKKKASIDEAKKIAAAKAEADRKAKVEQERKAKEEELQKLVDAQKERMEKFREHCLNPYNNTHNGLVEFVKSKMIAPKSFDLQGEGKFGVTDNGKAFVSMTYTGKNAFGVEIQHYVRAEVNPEDCSFRILEER